MEQLAKFSPSKVAWAEIGVIDNDNESDRIYKLDDRFKQQLRLSRHQEDRVISTIDGKLEQINIHNKEHTFRIWNYSSSSNYFVNCEFPPNLLATVQTSLGAFVSVSGECFYRPDAPYPYKINVREMNVLPRTEQLPTLRGLYGIAPDATGGRSSEQFVRELRDKWGEVRR